MRKHLRVTLLLPPFAWHIVVSSYTYMAHRGVTLHVAHHSVTLHMAHHGASAGTSRHSQTHREELE